MAPTWATKSSTKSLPSSTPTPSTSPPFGNSTPLPTFQQLPSAILPTPAPLPLSCPPGRNLDPGEPNALRPSAVGATRPASISPTLRRCAGPLGVMAHELEGALPFLRLLQKGWALPIKHHQPSSLPLFHSSTLPLFHSSTSFHFFPFSRPLLPTPTSQQRNVVIPTEVALHSPRAFLSAPGHAAEGSLFDLRVLPPPKKLAPTTSHFLFLFFPHLP